MKRLQNGTERAFKRPALFVLYAAILGAISGLPARAGITYSCDATIDAAQAGTCNYLNTITAGAYASTFSNANASIYIKMGNTPLGESTTGFYNSVSYSTYLADLTANSLASGNAVQAAAVSALNTYDTSAYGSDQVVITSALGEALGIPDSSLVGTTAGGAPCTIGTGGCYNGIITITTSPFVYWDQQGGTQPAIDYDFYNVVEHETNEVLGTASCISTTDPSALLTDACDSDTGGTGTPSAVDLYRYSNSASLALNINCIGLAYCGNAYFSYNGGTTNGSTSGSQYNTAANGYDYADFAGFACPGGPLEVQNGSSCPGTDPLINTDDGVEINILNAVGFEEGQTTPEPGTVALFGAGFAILFGARSYLRRKRAVI